MWIFSTMAKASAECNPGSIHLLEKHGFSLWGSLPQVAQLAQGWYSHLYYVRAL